MTRDLTIEVYLAMLILALKECLGWRGVGKYRKEPLIYHHAQNPRYIQ